MYNIIMRKKGLRTWIEINTHAIGNNIEIFRSIILPKTKIMAVVKSNAYGHGLVDFSKEVVKKGVEWLAVDSVVEGLALRRESIDNPILVLGFTLPEMLNEAMLYNLSVTVSSFSTINNIKANCQKSIKAHIKVDTGLHRQGFLPEEMELLINTLKQNKHCIQVEGLYTHFAAAKDPMSTEFTKKQIQIFKKWVDAFKNAGFSPLIHASATAGTILFSESHFDIVRVGAGLYGIWTSQEIKEKYERVFKFEPALSWKTIISEIKIFKKGDAVGYDLTEKLERDSKIAICPIGYWHGYSRSLSSIGFVLVNDVKVKVLGRISMDMIIIDITDVPQVEILDEVFIIGKSGKEKITAQELASLSQMSVCEFVTRINPLIKRIYI